MTNASIPASGSGTSENTVPLVSVIMPAYNAIEYIDQAILSVLQQDVPLELIVINDCSADQLDRHMEKYAGDSRVIYLKNAANLGAGKSRNRGVSEASGKYIAFLDADDLWAEDKLKKQLKYLLKTKRVLCCTARELLHNDGSSTGKIIPVKAEITYPLLLRHNSINCSSVLIEKKIAREFPMIHEDAHEDYYTWLCILKKYGPACGINEPLLKYRLSRRSKSRNKLKSVWMTFKVYRYMGYNLFRSLIYLFSYIAHGIQKYS